MAGKSGRWRGGRNRALRPPRPASGASRGLHRRRRAAPCGMTAPLDAAILAFSAGADIRANAARIHAALATAAPARLLLTPECALIGYPGAGRASCADIDWGLVADQEERLAAAAGRAGVVLVLGSASP